MKTFKQLQDILTASNHGETITKPILVWFEVKELNSFHRAETDHAYAVGKLKQEIKAIIKNPSLAAKVHISRPEFDQFDSGNMHHAFAMWKMYITGPKELIDLIYAETGMDQEEGLE